MKGHNTLSIILISKDSKQSLKMAEKAFKEAKNGSEGDFSALYVII